jgi:anti-sigma regulatory factor (Ser/Thr protein kinase)
MRPSANFFVSYTDADRTWAEWIAWQLEADGYDVVIQAWDFLAGRDFVHEMHHATATAERVVLVLSPDYLTSEHGEAEWRPFFDDDPSGEAGRILPVRVRPVERQGLLRSRIFVDLVDRTAVSARTALIAAAREARGKPPTEPEYPGADSKPTVVERPPDYPGAASAKPHDLDQSIRVDDRGALRAFVAEAASTMHRLGFTDDDVHAFEVSVRELVDNVAPHVPPDATIRLEVGHTDPRQYRFHEGLHISVEDHGPGFDFNAALEADEAELLENGDEHGLLRAYRYGSRLVQVSTTPHKPHIMGWSRERSPVVRPSALDHDDVVPFVFSYEHEAILISRDVHTFFRFERFLQRSEQFMDLVFDPLVRPARRYVGIEVVGNSWTGVLRVEDVLARLISFARRYDRFRKELIVFADAGPSTQRWLREFVDDIGLTMFEDASAAREFLAASSPRSATGDPIAGW